MIKNRIFHRKSEPSVTLPEGTSPKSHVQSPLIQTWQISKYLYVLEIHGKNSRCALFCDCFDEVCDAGYDAGGKDACAGDSGGPLVCQVWITSGF